MEELIDEKTWMLENPHHFLIMRVWDALSGNANRMKQQLNNTGRCWNHVFLRNEQLKNCQVGTNLTRKLSRGPTMWKGMLKNVLNDTVKWQTRKWSQLYKVSSPCLDGQRQNCVYADSVLCVGQMKDSPEPIERWRSQVQNSGCIRLTKKQ